HVKECPVSGPMTQPETYVIHLEGIRFRARHGVSRAERDLPQDFVVDLDVELPIGLLPRTDSRSRVFDYDKLATLVVDEGTKASYKFLESIASRLIDRILDDTPATLVNVKVKKFGPPTSVSVDAVSVELTGKRRPSKP